MKRNIITVIAIMALASAAHAGGIGIGNTYNTTNNTTNNQGGEGGTGVGVGVASSKSTATAGAAAGAVSNSGGNMFKNDGNNSAQSVTVQGDSHPVSSAIAAPLTASNGTCMGSTSAGAQGVTIGVSVGTTWTDSDCDRRYDAQELRAQGHVKAATALMCQKPSIAAAMKEAGTPCPSGAKTAAAPAQANVAQVEYTDPIIRARLGLSPLAE